MAVAMHMLHNIALVGAYVALATYFLQRVHERLLPSLPKRLAQIARASLFGFFILCAFDHFEDAFHTAELPPDYFYVDHLMLGTLQAVAAWVVVALLWRAPDRPVRPVPPEPPKLDPDELRSILKGD